MGDGIGWVRPGEAIRRLSPLLGGDDAAKALLAGRLRDRTLAAGCSYVTEAYDIGQVPFVFVDPIPPSVSEDPDIEVKALDPNFPRVTESKMGSGFVFWESGRPPRFMRIASVRNLSSDWSRDLSRWNWADGIFVFTRRPVVSSSDATKKLSPKLRYPTRTVMYGVRFAEADIRKLVADFAPKSVATAGTRKRKRRQARKVDWTEINMQLAAFAYVRGLDEGLGAQFERPGWQTALRDWIAARLDTMEIDCDATVIDDEIARIIEAINLERSGKYVEQDGAMRRKPR